VIAPEDLSRANNEYKNSPLGPPADLWDIRIINAIQAISTLDKDIGDTLPSIDSKRDWKTWLTTASQDHKHNLWKTIQSINTANTNNNNNNNITSTKQLWDKIYKKFNRPIIDSLIDPENPNNTLLNHSKINEAIHTHYGKKTFDLTENQIREDSKRMHLDDQDLPDWLKPTNIDGKYIRYIAINLQVKLVLLKL
jgi:hypothetical protein